MEFLLGLLPDFEQHHRWRHPERSRSSGGARDLARGFSAVRARSLDPLVKARAFGMTPRSEYGAGPHQPLRP